MAKRHGEFNPSTGKVETKKVGKAKHVEFGTPVDVSTTGKKFRRWLAG